MGLLLVATFATSQLLAAPLTKGEQTPVGKQATEGEQVAIWLEQLDDDHFDIRHRAQQQLEQVRPVPLDAVAKAANLGSLESTTRALNILLGWSESEDESLRLTTLEKISNLSHRPREAARANRMLADRREKIALQSLVKLGARISPMRIGILANRQVDLNQRWKGGDEGLKHLRDVRGISILRLHGAPVTDAGLKYLAELPEVQGQRMELYGIQTSKAAIQKLENQFTGVLDARSGALLGVKGNLQDKGTVTEVVANSAAAKAGILQGDRITEFNGDAIEDFETLTRRIAEHQPGDTVTLTILRKGKTQKLQATFDRWGVNESISNGIQIRNNNILLQRALPGKQALPQKIKIKVLPR